MTNEQSFVNLRRPRADVLATLVLVLAATEATFSVSPATAELVGYDYAHAIVDDHARLGYVELLKDQRAQTVTAFVARALAFLAAHGIDAKRLMTDNAWSYTLNRSLRELLAEQGSAIYAPHASAPAKRQGRALPPDDGTRMGLRHPLPPLPRPRRRPATLAGAGDGRRPPAQ